jgi:molybdate transport system ATP-binding protein
MRARLCVALHAVSVQRGDKWALRDVSLELSAGERWALIGGNGAGKTQLLKLIGTVVWPTPTGRETLTYRVGRRSVAVIEAKERIAYVGAELQDKYARYGWNLGVEDLLATGLHRTDLLQRPVTARERLKVGAMRALCGLDALAGRRFLSLSYGQKRLALLGRALIQEPDWLLLDEFYNGLDRDYRRRVDGLLEHACRRGQSWIASAHRAMDVPRGTQGLIEMRAGRIVAIKRLGAADLSGLARRAAEVAAARPIAAPKAPRTPRAPPVGRRPHAGKTRRSPPRKRLLRIRQADLYVEYREVLRGVNWELHEGEHWAVFGANGAGKSSFLKLLYGDLSPAQGGSIERTGFPRGTSIFAWKRRVGLVSPELQTDHAVNVTVMDLVASGRHASIGLAAPRTAADERHARRWLKYFALLSVAKRRPWELSYGQMRRALIARALAGNVRILLLDEPLTGLDPRQRALMKRLLERLMKRRLTLIIAVHHAEDLPRGMTHGLNLHNQRAVQFDLRSAT